MSISSTLKYSFKMFYLIISGGFYSLQHLNTASVRKVKVEDHIWALEWRESWQEKFKMPIEAGIFQRMETERQRNDVGQFLVHTSITDWLIYSTGLVVFAANFWELLRGFAIPDCSQKMVQWRVKRDATLSTQQTTSKQATSDSTQRLTQSFH